jgi:hypothetical protein
VYQRREYDTQLIESVAVRRKAAEAEAEANAPLEDEDELND